MYLSGLCPLLLNSTLSLSHTHASNTLSIFTRALSLPRKYPSSVDSLSHSFLYCSICTLAAKKYFFVVARWSAGDVSFRGMETTTGRNDSIKRFDCSSRDDCPLIENCPSAPLDQEREKLGAEMARRVPIWRAIFLIFEPRDFERVTCTH